MSKPLATKTSTSLSEIVQIGPKVSIFCVATIIFQHCHNPLGHGVHQSFTGCHWSPLPLLHDGITELVDVRDLVLLHLPFEDAPQILNRVWVWRHAWRVHHLYPSASLASQWTLCWNTALRRDEGRGSCSASVGHSACWPSWFPQCSPRPWHSYHHAWL